MSMSTPGPERNPSTVKVDKTTGAGKPPAGKAATAKPTATKPDATKAAGKSTGARPGGTKPAAGKGPKGRKPIKPVQVSGGRNWGPMIVVGVVVLVALGVIGWGVFAVVKDKNETSTPWDKRAAAIKGIVNYRTSSDKTIQSREHKNGVLSYSTNPPVGGDHANRWENCMGDVYPAPIPKENAVHSLEHGAVWITYRPGLPADQVAKLAAKVKGRDYMLMSPYTGLDHTVSLQAWGYQLKVDKVTDPRIDQFIKALRLNAQVEPGAICSSGVTATGDVPQET
jgi:hypothetical protein